MSVIPTAGAAASPQLQLLLRRQRTDQLAGYGKCDLALLSLMSLGNGSIAVALLLLRTKISDLSNSDIIHA